MLPSLQPFLLLSLAILTAFVTESTILSPSNVVVRDRDTLFQTKDGSLIVTGTSHYTGENVIGQFKSDVTEYSKKTDQSEVIIRTEFQYYNGINLTIFKQTFPNGLSESATGDRDGVITGYPCYKYDELRSNIGFWSLGDHMFGWMQQAFGIWGNQTDMKNIASGLKTGPLVVLDSIKNVTQLISSFDSFMVTHAAYGFINKQEVCYGIMGNISSVPKGYTVSFIQVSAGGVVSPRTAFRYWGDVMTKWYGKSKSAMENDLTVNYLGYYTDNGAYYYYKTATNKTYEQTVDDIIKHANDKHIPYKYIQYDSWFYPKDENAAVTQWIATKETFPHNLTSSYQKHLWPIVAHNRYFSPKTDYAKQNGGPFNFKTEEQIAVPSDPTFWKFLLQQAKQWGLVTYEQDWQNLIFENAISTTSDLNVGSDMLLHMGQAASELGLNIQFCMALSKSAYQSLLIPAVSQARVSDDYKASSNGAEQWRIGGTSMFAWALNVAPFKDNFWSSKRQPNNSYGLKELYPELQSVVSTLSAGPVANSDRIKFENRELIMKSVDETGLILKPDQPAFAIDKQLVQQTKLINDGPKGEVWTTFSNVGGVHMHGIIFSADLKENYYLSIDDMGFDIDLNSIVYDYELSFVLKMSENGKVNKIPLQNCGLEHFCLYHTSPRLTIPSSEQSVYILGDMSKWVPMSTRRVVRISINYDSVEIELRGGPKEEIGIYYLLEDSEGFYLNEVKTQMDLSGRNVVRIEADQEGMEKYKYLQREKNMI